MDFHMNAALVRFKVMCIKTYLELNLQEEAINFALDTVNQINQIADKTELGKYKNNIVDLINNAILMMMIGEREEAINIVKKVDAETIMQQQVAKYFFMMNVDDLPLDVKEYIANLA